MSADKPQYDVAISFLSKDEHLAASFHEKLSEGLRVFFYSRNQEDLAGTDGLESMRKPFFDDSRINVVLFREPWGETPWTRVEETAIKESCLEHGWERLFFIVLDRNSTLPVWLPKTHVRFNYEDFGLEQAIGAIKARAQERGSKYTPMTALKRAEIYRAEERYRRDKGRMSSEEGMRAIFQSVTELFGNIDKHCSEITAKGSMQVRWGKELKEQNSVQHCVLTNDRVGMIVAWHQPYSNTLHNSNLVVSEYNSGLIVPQELGQRMYFSQPEKISETKYVPELSRAREYGWRQESATQFLSSSSLAERCVIQFVELINRYESGELPKRTAYF